MPITITCPECSKKLSAPESSAGEKVRCPACKAIVSLPAVEVEAQEAEPQVVEPTPDDAVTESSFPVRARATSEDDEDAVTEKPRRRPRDDDGYGIDEDDEAERRERKRRRRRDEQDDEDDEFSVRRRRPVQAHRGVVILVLGILAIPGACLPLIAFILASIALNMANTDKPKMERGHMDPSGMAMVTAGQVCAYIGVIFGLINCVLGIALQVGGKF